MSRAWAGNARLRAALCSAGPASCRACARHGTSIDVMMPITYVKGRSTRSQNAGMLSRHSCSLPLLLTLVALLSVTSQLSTVLSRQSTRYKLLPSMFTVWGRSSHVKQCASLLLLASLIALGSTLIIPQ